MREEEEWAARDEARRIEVEGLKAELEAMRRVVEGSGGVDGKLSTLYERWHSIYQLWPVLHHSHFVWVLNTLCVYLYTAAMASDVTNMASHSPAASGAELHLCQISLLAHVTARKDDSTYIRPCLVLWQDTIPEHYKEISENGLLSISLP